MEMFENKDSQLTVIDSSNFDGEITVIDKETDEIGKVVSQAENGDLVVHWLDADDSDFHEEFELISIYAPNVKLVIEKESEEFEYIENPFGGWLADKLNAKVKRAKAGRAFKKRLKAESALERAKKKEQEAVSSYRENPEPRHRRYAK